MRLTKHTWSSIRNILIEIRPELTEIIDQINPPEDYYLYEIEYEYGAMLLERGVFQIPNMENNLVPLAHSSIPNQIKEDLSYSATCPMGIISKNSIETHLISKSKKIPVSLYKKGDIVSLWRVLEEDDCYQLGSHWNISSGARTICVLPKITDKMGYHALKVKYGFKIGIPKSLTDHWDLLKHLANHEKFSDRWSSKIIFFARKWFDHKEDKAWESFSKYLFNDVWKGSSFRRNQFIFDFAFSLVQESRNLKPNPYLSDTVRHLIAISSGASPAFTLAIDETTAPVSALQRVLTDDYGLKKYSPMMMHSHHFSMQENRPVYYSFQFPTTTTFSPRSNRLANTMTDMRELKYLLEILLSEIIKGNLDVEKTPLYTLAQNVKFSFFHTENDQLGEIFNSNELFNFYSNSCEIMKQSTQLQFPEHSPFFKGCVLIEKSN